MKKGRLRPLPLKISRGPDRTPESNTLNSGGRSIFYLNRAGQVQLGLKRKATKGPVDTILIDHGEMPRGDWPVPVCSRIGSRSDSSMPAKMVNGEAASGDLPAANGAYDCHSIVTSLRLIFLKSLKTR